MPAFLELNFDLRSFACMSACTGLCLPAGSRMHACVLDGIGCILGGSILSCEPHL